MSKQNVGGTSTYVVPETDTAVLHNMTLYLPGPAAVITPAILVALDADAAFVWEIDGYDCGPGIYQWSGREVFTTFLALTAWVFPYSFRANGYLLTAA